MILSTFCLSSCDKAQEALSKVKDMTSSLGLGETSGDFEKVTTTEGKKIIQDEERLVIVDFYLDT